ncbi:MAG: hypothetical protein HC919_14370 [Oscillatoriales cyanobacterium SM2_2_1]|nr:hypothetical protein [Oscillatoriales cyanobacterium SM2_2_1]
MAQSYRREPEEQYQSVSQRAKRTTTNLKYLPRQRQAEHPRWLVGLLFVQRMSILSTIGLASAVCVCLAWITYIQQEWNQKLVEKQRLERLGREIENQIPPIEQDSLNRIPADYKKATPGDDIDIERSTPRTAPLPSPTDTGEQQPEPLPAGY